MEKVANLRSYCQFIRLVRLIVNRSFKNGKASPLWVNFGKWKCLLCYFKVLISQFRRGKTAVFGV